MVNVPGTHARKEHISRRLPVPPVDVGEMKLG